MRDLTLFDAVQTLANLAHTLSDSDMEQPWSWRAHEDEGARFALLGSYHELRDLAITLAAERAQRGSPPTLAQRALAQYHEAYRDFQAVLIGAPVALYDQDPAPGEWPLRFVIGHIARSERTFFALLHYGVERQREGGERPTRLPEGEADRLTLPGHEFMHMWMKQGMAEMLAWYNSHHERVLAEFASISDEEMRGTTVWWEEEELSGQYRLHRFDAHLRQHTVQLEKTLEQLGKGPGEAKRLLRVIFRALAEVEGATLGADDLGLEARRALAATISERAERLAAWIAQAHKIVAAAQAGEVEQVRALLDHDARLADARSDEGISVLLSALYRGHEAVAALLVDAGATLNIFDAAALGRLERVQAIVAQSQEWVNEVARDGFTPLQLACFFGREEVALWLMEHGADVNAVAQNAQRITPIHAASAHGSLRVLRALLERGASVNATQQNDGTALHNAVGSGNLAMTRLLLEHGADATAPLATGPTPLDLARQHGDDEIAALLEEQGAT